MEQTNTKKQNEPKRNPPAEVTGYDVTDLLKQETGARIVHANEHSFGIPVAEAIFHTSVNGADRSPEERFTEGSPHKSRNVKMHWNEQGLWCEQAGKRFLVPASNVKSVYFK